MFNGDDESTFIVNKSLGFVSDRLDLTFLSEFYVLDLINYAF